ncbi:MAG TPA: Crp/Fnr family transcriptional regulator [Xanthobacteraceae bacterium]|nr:Crp/Fnr family transcriptional regulator [Xanthobacteraceae bacterium]
MVMNAREARERNQFLAALGPAELEWMLPHLTPYDLRARSSLYRCGDEIDEVIFPNSGLVTLTVPSREEHGALVLVVGHEGLVGGLAAAAEARATCDVDVMVGGEALRTSASAFRRALDEQPGIRRLAARFDSIALAQAQQTALCNAAHSVEARICRWMLEFQDRSNSNTVPLTQNTLAQMLGVRRTTVTLVAGRLEAAGVLKCRRRFLQIQSREKLEQHACECYGQLRGQPSGRAAEVPSRHDVHTVPGRAGRIAAGPTG